MLTKVCTNIGILSDVSTVQRFRQISRLDHFTWGFHTGQRCQVGAWWDGSGRVFLWIRASRLFFNYPVFLFLLMSDHRIDYFPIHLSFQHDARPTNCAAKVCKCKKGRDHQVDIENHRYSFEYCDYCGSVAAHVRCFKGEKFSCDECTAVVVRTEALAAVSRSANGIASSSSGNNSNLEAKYRMIASKFDVRDCSVPLIRLKAEDFGSTSKKNYQKCVQLRLIKDVFPTKSTTHTANRIRPSDEREIQPILKRPSKIDGYFMRIIDSDSDIEISPVTVTPSPKKTTFRSSDSGSAITMMNDANANAIISVNTQQAKAPATATSMSNSLTDRKYSTSEDEPNRPSVIVHNFHKPTSDDPMAGKENEKPIKTVAVVRPFSSSDTSFGQENNNIKTENYPSEAFYASSSGAADDSAYKSSITQRYDYLKNVPKREEPSVGIVSYTSMTTTTTTTTTTVSTIVHGRSSDANKCTPSKRKYRTVRSYFCESSSSSDEMDEPKPKRKSPKQSKRSSSAAHVERPPNQSTIVNFFQPKLNQGI